MFMMSFDLGAPAPKILEASFSSRMWLLAVSSAPTPVMCAPLLIPEFFQSALSALLSPRSSLTNALLFDPLTLLGAAKFPPLEEGKAESMYA
jgi:hypothetical protein